MEHRDLGGFDVSVIGPGCLPMVGYYEGVTFFDRLRSVIK